MSLSFYSCPQLQNHVKTATSQLRLLQIGDITQFPAPGQVLFVPHTTEFEKLPSSVI